ncbi:hypothetical protein AXF42_Ash017748 [Apostasia shenzhenica]|uniref:Uncharacterized protein n=1 Tax=Apostasia shenzhenica TaxID=1088818 RepID=A0A2I0B676_9ASPA|nr:hypothetical protein AXF42_Ash017748 [Apostasia shenzhenica]
MSFGASTNGIDSSLLRVTLEMSVPDQDEHGVKYLSRPSRDAISGIPIKKRQFVFPRSPSPPPQLQSLPAGHGGISTTENKSFCLKPFCSLEAGGSSPYFISLSHKAPPVGIDVTGDGGKIVSSKYESHSRLDINDWERNTGSIVVERQNGKEEIVSDGELLSLKRTQQLRSSPISPIDDPRAEGTRTDRATLDDTYASLSGRTGLQTALKGSNQKAEIHDKYFIKKGQLEMQDACSSKEEQCDLQVSMERCATNSKTYSAHKSVDRSNWDLNTTMDSWEDSSSDLALKHESDRLGKGLWSCSIQEVCKEPNASYGGSNEPKTLNKVFCLGLSSSSKSGGVLHTSETEASLDLRLKPSFMSESYFTYGTPFPLGKMDSEREMQFLSLSTNLTSFNPDPELASCGAVKHDPYKGCIRLNDMNTEIVGSKQFSFKTVKIEPTEIEHGSRLKIPEVADSVGDTAVKLEPMENGLDGDIEGMGKKNASDIVVNNANLFQSMNRSLEDIVTHSKVLDSLVESSLKDDILQLKSESITLLQSNIISKAEVMQHAVVYSKPVSLSMEPSVYEAKLLNSVEEAPGSTRADVLIKCQDDDAVKDMNSVKDVCKHHPSMGVNLMPENLACEAIEKKVDDAKAEDTSHMGSTLISSATKPVQRSCANFNVLENNQSNNGTSSSILEENGDSDYKPDSSHDADHLNGVNDDIDYEDGEVRDPAALAVNEVSHLRESKKTEDACPLGLVGFPAPSSLYGKNCQTGSPEMFKDPGTVECVSSHDLPLSTLADQQESSSVTGDSGRRKTRKTMRKISRDPSKKKDKGTELMSKSDGDSVLGAGNDDSQGDSNGAKRDIGAHTNASIPSITEAKKDAVIRGHTGRIISLNSVSGLTKPVHKMRLSSNFRSEKSADKSLKRENSYSHFNRDEISNERFRRNGSENNRSWACGKRGLDSIHMRERSESDSLQRGRDKRQPKQLHINRNFEPNCLQDYIDNNSEKSNEKSGGNGSGSNGSWACGKRGLDSMHMRGRGRSDSMHMRGRGGSDSMHMRGRGGSDSLLRCRDEKQPNQLHINRNFEPNFMREHVNENNDFIYSGSINSVKVTKPSASNATNRMTRLASNEQGRDHVQARRRSPCGHEQLPIMRYPATEVSPGRCMLRDASEISYVSQEKMMQQMSDEMVDASLCGHAHSPFERTNRMAIHRERRSLSPMLRRVLPQLPPMCSVMSQDISPHWSSHRASDGYNGEREMVEIRSASPVMLPESMRSSRPHFTEEMLARRQSSPYGERLSDVMMDAVSSRQHDFPRSGKHFARKMAWSDDYFSPKMPRLDADDTRQVSRAYRRSPFFQGQNYELDIDGECTVGRRYNNVHIPVRYRQHGVADDDSKDFHFHAEEGPTRAYRYQYEGNQGFDEGSNPREFKERFRNRLGNAGNRYRHMQEQQQQQQQQHHEGSFEHRGEKSWNNSRFNNFRQKRRRY